MSPDAKMIRTVGIIARPRREDISRVVPPLIEWLREHGAKVLCDTETGDCIGTLAVETLLELPARIGGAANKNLPQRLSDDRWATTGTRSTVEVLGWDLPHLVDVMPEQGVVAPGRPKPQATERLRVRPGPRHGLAGLALRILGHARTIELDADRTFHP